MKHIHNLKEVNSDFIDFTQTQNVVYWAKILGCSPKELQSTVSYAGNSIRTIGKLFGKEF